MRFCPHCGSQRIVTLSLGGCGGWGGRSGCEDCDSVYSQTDGGFAGGGNAFSRHEGESLKEYKVFRAKEIKILQSEHEDHKGQWFWQEIGGWTYHYFDTREEAEGWLAVYRKTLYDALPYPDCEKCGEKSEKKGPGWFRCRPCGLHRFTHYAREDRDKWFTKEELGWETDFD